MGIEVNPVSTHWNYFLCLEDDIAELARWIELTDKNFSCYSIELARLLMTASAEVDVIAKLICKKLKPDEDAEGINGYQAILTEAFPQFHKTSADIPKFGLKLHPWVNWSAAKNPPFWWMANNKVKHHRATDFHQATLKNVLNSVAGLLHLLIIYHGELKVPYESMPKLFLTNSFCVTIGGNIMYMPNKT
ncbi:MAG: hypothetical protein Q8J65_10110 [Nitrosomonadales bacterium]|nr:hypothetical protein [Nitrosomonadales bacterium]